MGRFTNAGAKRWPTLLWLRYLEGYSIAGVGGNGTPPLPEIKLFQRGCLLPFWDLVAQGYVGREKVISSTGLLLHLYFPRK